MRNKTTTLIALTITLFASACGFDEAGTADQQVANVESRLELDNGGFTMADEALFVAPDEALLAPTFDYDRDALTNAEQRINEIPELPDGLVDSTSNVPAGSSSAASNTGSAASNTGSAAGPNTASNVCARALFTGHWKAQRPGYGVWRGVIVNRQGRVIGFSHGIYGRGHFFGKLVHRGGKVWGLMKGLYRGGFFKGHLKTRDGVVAALRGRYSDGKFAGVIATRCAPQPPPSPCRAPAVLDVCPTTVRVCRSVTTTNNTSAANNTSTSASNTTTRRVCTVRCAAPVCRPPRRPATGSANTAGSSTPASTTNAGR